MQQSQSLEPSTPQYSGQYAQAVPQAATGLTAAQQQPRAVEVIVPAVTPQVQPVWPQAQTEISGLHVVKAGDTVYSLSRQQCTTVSSIQSLNNLDQNFAIQIGQSLRLPASECL